MKQILWFRRDLRFLDNAILSQCSHKVFPIFIFDVEILSKLPKDDMRVNFIYKSVLKLKKELQSIGLDLAIFFDTPKNVFFKLKDEFDEVVCSCDYDHYAISRDKEIEAILPMRRFYDSYLLDPNDGLKVDGTPYKVFTPFYKNLKVLWESNSIEEYKPNTQASLTNYDYSKIPSLISLGFEEITLPNFLQKSAYEVLEDFREKIKSYQTNRDFFYKDGTSNISVHLRFGTISPRQIFNRVSQIDGGEFFIRELFWREFYAYILYHFPKSEFENFNQKKVLWENNQEKYKAWCEGKTGVPIIDAAMQHLNKTGTMPNRLRMVVASFLTKNLLCDWRLGEQYFALKLLDYDASSNVGSWQWAASTGADSVPYFRVFNPYLQSKKFDKEAIFVKSVLKEFQNTNPKELHEENKSAIVDIKTSSKQAISLFKD